jgi:hypothetical protein
MNNATNTSSDIPTRKKRRKKRRAFPGGLEAWKNKEGKDTFETEKEAR